MTEGIEWRCCKGIYGKSNSCILCGYVGQVMVEHRFEMVKNVVTKEESPKKSIPYCNNFTIKHHSGIVTAEMLY